jgi:hypothetical protein
MGGIFLEWAVGSGRAIKNYKLKILELVNLKLWGRVERAQFVSIPLIAPQGRSVTAQRNALGKKVAHKLCALQGQRKNFHCSYRAHFPATLTQPAGKS